MLKFEDNRSDGINISKVNIGDIFDYEGKYYMKISRSVPESDNAVRLKDGSTRDFNDTAIVEVINNATLVFEN